MPRRNPVILLFLALLAGPASAQEMQVSFETPAQVWDDTTAQNLTWAVLVFSEDDVASGTLEAPFGAPVENHSHMRRFVETHTGVFDISHSSDTPLPVESTAWEGPRAEIAATPDRWSSLIVWSSEIGLDMADGSGSLLVGRGDRGMSDYLPGEVPKWTYDPSHVVPDRHAILTHSGASAFRLHAAGDLVLEWHEWITDCPAGCVDGAHTTATWHDQGVAEARVEMRPYTRLELQAADLVVQGRLHAIVAGGTAMDLNASRVRLPLATGEAACEDCLTLDRQDLQVNGSLGLRGLRADGSRLHAALSGEPTWMRVDEATIHPDRLFGAHPAVGAAVAAGLLAVAVAVLWKVKLASLFVRVTRDNALNHEGRRRVFEAVRAAPGSTAHALAKLAEHSRATIDHHLRKLCEVGLIVGKQTGKWSRYYENHGRYDSTWRQVHGFNDHHLQVLHAIVEQKEAVARSVLLDLVEKQLGWPRSTTRYRLQRLEEARLATRTMRQGRIWYEAHPAPPTPP